MYNTKRNTYSITRIFLLYFCVRFFNTCISFDCVFKILNFVFQAQVNHLYFLLVRRGVLINYCILPSPYQTCFNYTVRLYLDLEKSTK